MNDPSDPHSWIAYAEEDFVMARSALRRRQPLTYSACFHSQQCAEKYLKALLVSKGVSFPRTHDLLMLSGLCENSGVLIAIDPKQLNTLADYAVRVRYPGDTPTADDARQAREIARDVRRFVRQWFGLR